MKLIKRMTSNVDQANETSPLLNAENTSKNREREQPSNTLSTEGMTRASTIVDVGFTWSGSILTALGRVESEQVVALQRS